MYNFNKKLHLNSQKRFYNPDYFYFVTSVTHNRFPFFKEELFCELFIENLKICKELKKFKLYAFVIIPDHVHLLLKTAEKYNISQVMFSIKKQFSHNINRIVEDNNLTYIEGEQALARLHKGNEQILNSLNQKIVNKYRPLFAQKYGQPQFEIPTFKWKQSFHDHVIRNEKDFYKHLNYIANNYVKHDVGKNENIYRWSFLNEEWKNLLDDYTK